MKITSDVRDVGPAAIPCESCGGWGELYYGHHEWRIDKRHDCQVCNGSGAMVEDGFYVVEYGDGAAKIGVVEVVYGTFESAASPYPDAAARWLKKFDPASLLP